MPKAQTHLPIVRQWCQSLGILTAISISRHEAEMKLAAYVPMLLNRFPDAAFTTESLEFVAAQSAKGFPTYPELATALSAWWRQHRPLLALPPPDPTPIRPPPSQAEINAVHEITRNLVAQLRATADAKQRALDQQLAALRVTDRPRAIHIPPELLDRLNPLPNGRKRAP